MAGVLRFENTLAAGVTVANLLAGTFMERLGARAEMLTVYGVIDDAAALVGDVTAEIRLGNVILADAAVVPMTALRVGPNRNEHLIAKGVGAPFDLVQIRLFNGDAAAAAAYRFLVEEVAM